MSVQEIEALEAQIQTLEDEAKRTPAFLRSERDRLVARSTALSADKAERDEALLARIGVDAADLRALVATAIERLEAYLSAADAARGVRSEYESAWRQAKALGLDVPVREPTFGVLAQADTPEGYRLRRLQDHARVGAHPNF